MPRKVGLQFREAGKVLAQHGDDAPEPEPKKRREDGDGEFQKLVTKFSRHLQARRREWFRTAARNGDPVSSGRESLSRDRSRTHREHIASGLRRFAWFAFRVRCNAWSGRAHRDRARDARNGAS